MSGNFLHPRTLHFVVTGACSGELKFLVVIAEEAKLAEAKAGMIGEVIPLAVWMIG